MTTTTGFQSRFSGANAYQRATDAADEGVGTGEFDVLYVVEVFSAPDDDATLLSGVGIGEHGPKGALVLVDEDGLADLELHTYGDVEIQYERYIDPA